MTKKYLVAVDGSDHGWKALQLASDLASLSDTELIVLHVVLHTPILSDLQENARIDALSGGRIGALHASTPLNSEEKTRYHQAFQTAGDMITHEARARAERAGVRNVTMRGAEGSPAREIVALAKSAGADMIFLGSRGLGDAAGLLLGSVSHKVMHLAPCTCVAVK